jgi:hypothetical protein
MGEKARKLESRQFLASRRKAIMEKAAERRKVAARPQKQQGEAFLPSLRPPAPPPVGHA